jgi:hypothetical protein
VAAPDVASVPPWTVVRNWDVATRPLEVKYFRKRLISALKLVTVPLVGRKEKTLFAPFEPEYRFLRRSEMSISSNRL